MKKDIKKRFPLFEILRLIMYSLESSESLRGGVFSPYLDSIFIVVGVDLDLMPKIFLIHIFDIFCIFLDFILPFHICKA